MQERRFERLGGTRSIEVDVRVVAATNRDLQQLIADGEFREDLFYRLNVVPVTLPPLRQRASDIPLLVAHFLEKYGAGSKTLLPPKRWRRSSPTSGPATSASSRTRSSGSSSCRTATRSASRICPPRCGRERADRLEHLSEFALPEEGVDLEEVELDLVRQALDRTGGSAPKAAKLLGLTTKTLEARMQRLGL